MFVLEQNYPNPFNPSTTISFSIQTDQFVTLKVFNAIGEEMATLINKNLTRGTHNINFNADGLSSGFYIYRLESGNQVQVRKMMLLK
ncbi:MAG: T9SS type A sorting domain-containing protein [Ignavibacteriales bacterium]|nr:T9SS type A sorting domain-containing protein [Ignavibacteriales bacterium]